MHNRHVYFFAAALAAISLTIFSYKWLLTGLPLTPGAIATAWEVERQITYEADGGPAKVTVQIPGNTKTKNIVTVRSVAPRYGVSTTTVDGNRQMVFSTRNASGAQLLFVRTVVHQFMAKGPEEPVEPPRVREPTLSDVQRAAARDLLATAEAKSADDATLVTALLKLITGNAAADSVTEFAAGKPGPAVNGAAAVKLLALKGIAARLVNGIDLAGERRRLEILHWLEVFLDGAWQPYSLQTGEVGVPETFFPWWRGTAPLAKVEGGTNLKLQISLLRLEQRVLDLVLARGKSQRDELITFSLFGLPLATQDVYRILMVVPLGIFILVLLRNVVGVSSLGTFMPVLIALAFRETHLAWGLILFTVVVGTGLLFRYYLEHMKLLLVPRLASVLIFVVLLMAALSVVTNALGFERGLSVALFPMVIMTMTIERVSIIWDERGPAEALTQAMGSLAIAVFCYLVMTRQIVEHLFFTFPELLLLLLAATALLGRYTGYRLLELKRFRVLTEEKP